MQDSLPPQEESAPTGTSTSHVAETGESLSEVLAQLTEGVATLNAEGVVISWNPTAAQLTGYSITEVNRIRFWTLFDEPDAMREFARQARHGIPVDERIVLTRSDGQRIPVGVRCSPLRHLGETAGRLVVVMRDLSELEALHAELLQSERLSILGRLAGAVSHEIRNPLTAIFLQADILENEVEQPDGGSRQQVLRSVEVIKEEVTRLHDVVQQYLSLARLSNLQREPVHLRPYLERFCTEIQDQLTSRGIVLCLECPTDLGQVNLHPNSFRRVLHNLVNNAVEAMPEGGALTIRGRSQASVVSLDISDTGCGIPDEQLPLLFSPLHTTKSEGTGLGLYLVDEIVSAHEGDITVSSQPGVTTTFTLTLPIVAKASTA